MESDEVFDFVVVQIILDEVFLGIFSLQLIVESDLEIELFECSSLFKFFLGSFKLGLFQLRDGFLMLGRESIGI